MTTITGSTIKFLKVIIIYMQNIHYLFAVQLFVKIKCSYLVQSSQAPISRPL